MNYFLSINCVSQLLLLLHFLLNDQELDQTLQKVEPACQIFQMSVLHITPQPFEVTI